MHAVPQLLTGSIHTCSDKIFSGHTLVATLLAAFWFHMAAGRGWPGRLYAAANWLLMVTCSLSGRHHYTVDIVVGAIVAALLFHCYHLLVRMAVMEEIMAGASGVDGAGIVIMHRHHHERYPYRILLKMVTYMDGIDLRRREGGKVEELLLPK
jgi:hypothetical protein